MLDQRQRAAILELHAKDVGIRKIASTLDLSRKSVRGVLKSNSTEVPIVARKEKAEPYRQQILDLLPRCKGNNALSTLAPLVRVHWRKS